MQKTIQAKWLPVLLACSAYGLSARAQLVRDPAATHEIPPFTVPAVKPGVAYERFIVIGDLGTGGAGQIGVGAQMARRAEQDGLDFWLTTGDNIYPNGVESVDDPQWVTKLEEAYGVSPLRVPIYATLGNHDHRGSVQAQVDYGRRNKNWRMTAAYYTFTRKLTDGSKIQFFAIDSTPIHKGLDGTAAQLTWLNDELGKSTARWKMAFGHHPLYGHHPTRGYNKTMIANFEPLFVKHGLDVYFAGHDHTLEMLKPVNGVHYVISGAAGGPEIAYNVKWTDESYYAATLGGFVLCRISSDELVIEFVRMEGKTQYAHVLTK